MKHLDLHTYGKTPACVYLAFQLTQIGDPRLANRVGQALTHFRDLVGGLIRANDLGAMNQHQVSSFAQQLRRVADEQHDKFKLKNQLIADLVRNIMIGELKSLQRRGAMAKYEFKEMQRAISDAPGELMAQLMRHMRPKVSDFQETITADTLMDKSLRKLQRKGKLSTLY